MNNYEWENQMKHEIWNLKDITKFIQWISVI